jgi:ribulose-phosphate 3-epimerase
MDVSLSLWSVDQANLAESVRRYDPLVQSFHVDVMDGRFVGNLLFGPLTVETLRGLTDKQIVAHLMVAEPRRWVAPFVDAGADLVAIHTSASGGFSSTVHAIREAGVAAGAAIGLQEPSQPIFDNLAALSAVLVMGTDIGVKGAPLDEAALRTVQRLTSMRDSGKDPEVFVDGGIRWPSVPLIAAAGADGVIAGSIVTAAEDPRSAVARIAALGA